MAAQTTQNENDITIEQSIDIDAPIRIAFEALLDELGPLSEMPGGEPFPFKLEAWPGGRWYRDLGNNSGHFWGHVQVIKPPTLLEICGPMFMSYAAVNHLQWRLKETDEGARLTLIHRATGQISDEHREGVREGWSYGMNRVKEIAEGRRGDE